MQIEGSILPWKTLIAVQLKQQNQQQNYFDLIIKNYSHIWESRENLQSQCRKLEQDLNSLRLAHSNLEKSAGASEELDRINIKLKEANEEVVQQLRENSKLAREVLRLNLTVEELNEKYVKEETKARKYQIENEELRQKLKETESNLAELQHIHQNVQEEVEPMRDQLKNLKNQYNQWDSTFLTLRQQLEEAERMKKHLEAEVIFQKNRQAEMHDLEIERNKQSMKKNAVQHSPNAPIFFDDDVVIISSTTNGNPFQDTMYPPEHDSLPPMRKTNSQNSIKTGGSRLLNNFIRKISTGISMDPNERAYRPSISCGVASIPNNEVTHWDCTDLEVYSLQFQPFGSILATGCSDKYLRLWEISSTGYQHKYCTLNCTSGSISAIDFDNECRRLIAGCGGNQAHLWSYGDTKILKDTYTGHKGQIFTCKFLPGSKLATGSADCTIRVWDISTGQCTRTLLIGSKCHDLVVMDATGTIISGHYDKNIRIWDPNDDQCRTKLEYDASITSLAFNDARQQLLACFRNDILRLIDLRQNKPLFTFSHENFKVKTDTSKAILSPDGQYACAGSHDGSLIFWNMEQNTCERVLHRRHSTMVTGVAWHPEGKYVASCEKHRRVILWSD